MIHDARCRLREAGMSVTPTSGEFFWSLLPSVGNCFERARSRSPEPFSRLGNCDHALRFVEHVGQDEGDMNRKSSTASARKMRKNSTDAELKLWKHLRNRLTDGEKFYFGFMFVARDDHQSCLHSAWGVRLLTCSQPWQQPIGKYIVDFVCAERKLVVEVDGGQHGEQIAYDNERTACLESEGYRVLRFWNNEVLEDVEVVLEVIIRALNESELYHPHPDPLPSREREL
jgi:very-short-patch-repair endonuclease